MESVSQLVREIEDTLKDHKATAVSAAVEENPLTIRKKQLAERLETLSAQLHKARDQAANLRKEKQNIAKHEKSLKEDLAWELEQKEVIQMSRC